MGRRSLSRDDEIDGVGGAPLITRSYGMYPHQLAYLYCLDASASHCQRLP